jgi:transposase-like protein
MSKKRVRHSAEQIVKNLRDVDAMLASGKSVGEILQSLSISEATLSRWRSQYGGMKCEEAKRLKQLEDENNRLKKLVAEQALDIQMLKQFARGNCRALKAVAKQLHIFRRNFRFLSVVPAACLINLDRVNALRGNRRMMTLD